MNTNAIYKRVAVRGNFNGPHIKGYNYPKRQVYAVYYNGSPVAVYVHSQAKWYTLRDADLLTQVMKDPKDTPNNPLPLIEMFNLSFLRKLEPAEIVHPKEMRMYAEFGEKYARALLLSRLTGESPDAILKSR